MGGGGGGGGCTAQSVPSKRTLNAHQGQSRGGAVNQGEGEGEAQG